MSASEQDLQHALRALGQSAALRRARHLDVAGAHGDLSVLAGALSFSAVRRFLLRGHSGTEAFLKAGWFHSLRELAVAVVGHAQFVAGLGGLPDLHTLSVAYCTPDAVRELAAGTFPALGRLKLDWRPDPEAAETLTGAAFPALTALEIDRRDLRNDGFAALMAADWFARLRVLDVSCNALGDRVVKALAAHPVAKGLRVLRIGENPFGKTALQSLVKKTPFPSLTTLDLASHSQRKATEADMVAFVNALAVPGLRHLSLSGWPLGEAGAKALAASPALANLTGLDLDGCGIGDAGARAILESRHLQNLVSLRISVNNLTGDGVSGLADPGLMPRLRYCPMLRNAVPRDLAERIRAAGRAVPA